MDNMKHRRLQELDRSDFEIVKDEPDIRGWDVKNEQGQKIGEVEELIIDAHQKKVRYMVVDLNNNELKLDHKKVLLPIGLAELDKKDDDVILPGITVEQVRTIPEYKDDELTPEIESKICHSLGRTGSQISGEVSSDTKEKVNPDFYKHEYYNLDNLYKNRMHEAQPANQGSEYERGLQLWERRSEGLEAPANVNPEGASRNEHNQAERAQTRRAAYEKRRFPGGSSKDNTIINKIKNEGLQ